VANLSRRSFARLPETSWHDFGREVARASHGRYMQRGSGASCAAEEPDMRTEIENAVSEIRQGITLLRRHL
jgi:hypothetical protein